MFCENCDIYEDDAPEGMLILCLVCGGLYCEECLSDHDCSAN